MKYAGFWKRFVATILDFFVLIIPLFALNWVLPYAGSVILCILYYPVFESSSLRATPGKYWMGLQVLNENGEGLSFARALGRFFLKYLSTCLLMLGYIIQLFTVKRQTLHDMIVSAVVIDQVQPETPDWINTWMKSMRYILRTEELEKPSTSENSSAVYDAGPATTSAAAVQSIEKLYDLYKGGILTEEEFQNKKSELLKQI